MASLASTCVFQGPWIRPDGMESWTTISGVAERNPGYQYVPRQGSEAVGFLGLNVGIETIGVSQSTAFCMRTRVGITV